MSSPTENKESNHSSDKTENTSKIDFTSTTRLSQYIGSRESTTYYVYPGTEREEYDFTAERRTPYSTTLVESTAHLIKACLGTGILSIHEGFKFTGLWTALVVTILLGLVLSHVMLMLVRSAQKAYVLLRIPKLTYPDLAEVAVATGPWKGLRCYSKWFRYTIDLCLFLQLCGTCCIYEIMIANTLKQVIEAVSTDIKDYQLSVRTNILIIAIPLIGLCLIKKLKYLAPFSLIADIFVAICVAAAMYYSLMSGQNIKTRPPWKNTVGLIRFCSICVYSLDGVAVILPVENNMRRPKYFYIVVQYGMTIVILSVATVGFFGYWAWGEQCQSPVTLHMPTMQTFPIVMQFLLSIMLCITFAVHFWVVFRVVWHYISRKHGRKHGLWERLYRALHVVLITSLSVAFPHLIKLMEFLGSFCLSYVAFVFPPVIDTFVNWHMTGAYTRLTLLKNCLLILFGLAMSTSAFYTFSTD